jgi:uncharacterized protein YdbL (DUF1318 family)
MSVLKEYNIRRHYNTNHCSLYNNIPNENRKQKYEELIKKSKLTTNDVEEINK